MRAVHEWVLTLTFLDVTDPDPKEEERSNTTTNMYSHAQ